MGGTGGTVVYPYIPTELPEQTILSNLKDVKEVKAFLNKYPDATMMVDRSGGGLEVDYTVTNLSKYPNATTTKFDNSTGKLLIIDNNGATVGEYRSLQLRVFLDDEGKPRDMSLTCHGNNGFPIFNILNYIETENCID